MSYSEVFILAFYNVQICDNTNGILIFFITEQCIIRGGFSPQTTGGDQLSTQAVCHTIPQGVLMLNGVTKCNVNCGVVEALCKIDYSKREYIL